MGLILNTSQGTDVHYPVVPTVFHTSRKFNPARYEEYQAFVEYLNRMNGYVQVPIAPDADTPPFCNKP
jgi:hypothetical protein